MTRGLVPWKRRQSERPARIRRGGNGNPFLALHDEMEDLFDDFFSDFGWGELPGLREGRRTATPLAPRVDVDESDDEIAVSAELPGLEEKDVEVSLDEDVLTISGEKRDEWEDKRKNAYISERSYGRFERSIPLPAGVDRENVKARFKKGVLHVTIPKTQEARADRKQIPVSSE